MWASHLMAAVCVVLLGTATVEPRAKAMSGQAVESPQAAGMADALMQTSVDGIGIWARIMELGRQEGFTGLALTMFVPSDAAFMTLPAGDLSKLLAPTERDLRHAFLTRAATDARILPQEIAGKRTLITTLNGRLLAIDATGGELMVGDAEAVDVKTMPDGRVIYVLDQPLLD